jgi:hypothetical protein
MLDFPGLAECLRYDGNNGRLVSQKGVYAPTLIAFYSPKVIPDFSSAALIFSSCCAAA